MSTSSQVTPPSAVDSVDKSPRAPAFVTTQWSQVLSAGRNDTTRARAALAELCETYWPALNAYVRRRGFRPHDAEDLTQEFFSRLLEHNWIARADAEKGRFRSFLLTMLDRFIADEWDKIHAKKRGAGLPAVPLDSNSGGRGNEPAADEIYDRQWALALLERVMARLRDEYARGGKASDFKHLKAFLTASRNEIPYTEVATAAGLTEGAARVAVHRLRRRYRELFREEISRTVADSAEVDEELRYLIAVLARR